MFASLGETPYLGVVVLRAVLLVRVGQGDEALSLMLQAQAAIANAKSVSAEHVQAALAEVS